MDKTVLIDFTLRVPLEVPEDWDDYMIEFFINDSSSCGDNFLERINEFAEKRDKEGDCACSFLTGRVASCEDS